MQASQNKLRDSKPTGVKMHADDCTHEPALPADLRRYEVHDEEFEAACCAVRLSPQSMHACMPCGRSVCVCSSPLLADGHVTADSPGLVLAAPCPDEAGL